MEIKKINLFCCIEDFNDNDNLYQITDAEHQSEIVDNFQMNQEKDADMRKYEQCQMKIVC